MDLILKHASEQKKKEVENSIWKNSALAVVDDLKPNNVGIVGEQFIQSVCDKGGIEAQINGATTKEIGGGTGDGKIKKKDMEIKTARLGNSQNTFQHELGETPWKAEYMCFVDISPHKLYVSIFPNMTEEQYKTRGFKCPYFPTKGITWRKKDGNFKLDTSPKINETQAKVDNPNTFVWSTEEDYENLFKFINRIIKTEETSLETAMNELTL